jgi:hypothetical protein
MRAWHYKAAGTWRREGRRRAGQRPWRPCIYGGCLRLHCLAGICKTRHAEADTVPTAQQQRMQQVSRRQIAPGKLGGEKGGGGLPGVPGGGLGGLGGLAGTPGARLGGLGGGAGVPGGSGGLAGVPGGGLPGVPGGGLGGLGGGAGVPGGSDGGGGEVGCPGPGGRGGWAGVPGGGDSPGKMRGATAMGLGGPGGCGPGGGACAGAGASASGGRGGACSGGPSWGSGGFAPCPAAPPSEGACARAAASAWLALPAAHSATAGACARASAGRQHLLLAGLCACPLHAASMTELAGLSKVFKLISTGQRAHQRWPAR